MNKKVSKGSPGSSAVRRSPHVRKVVGSRPATGSSISRSETPADASHLNLVITLLWGSCKPCNPSSGGRRVPQAARDATFP